jgi:hypothetical protein
LSSVAGGFGWKGATIAGASLGSIGAVGLLLAGAGVGPPSLGTESNGLPACTLENLIWSTTTETATDGAAIVTLAFELREPDWYEGFLHALGRDRHVDSPCRIDANAEIAVHELRPLPDAPPKLSPVPLVPFAALAADGAPASVPVRLDLRLGDRVPVARARLSNWCGDAITAGVGFRMASPGGPPGVSGSLQAPVERLPACLDVGLAARLTAESLAGSN